MNTVALFMDFDLTCTEELQQYALVRKFIDRYRIFYRQRENLEKIQTYVPDFTGFEEPSDFFKVLNAERKEVEQIARGVRCQNGVTWMGKLCKDMAPGGPLEGCTISDFEEAAQRIVLSPGLIEFFEQIKQRWHAANVKVKIYIVSVGLGTLIRGALGETVDGVYAGEIVNGNVVSVVEDYSKTEAAFMIAKGGTHRRDAKLRGNEYVIPYSRFIAFGDGNTDIPTWAFFRKRGARCIMVYERGNSNEYNRTMKVAPFHVDYLLERDYTPNEHNATWVYINRAIGNVVNRTCQHSEISLHHFKWSRKMCETEREEIRQHLLNCNEHEIGFQFTHVVPRVEV